MGNGKTVGDIAPTAIAPKSAKVLWSTYNTGTAPVEGAIISNVTFSNDTIRFDASGVKGNVVIAAYDGEGCTGNIVWIWHIWSDPDLDIYGQSPANVIDFPMGIEETQTVRCIDRELGALSNGLNDDGTVNTSDLLCAGFNYQWGRKDPFAGPANYRSASSVEQQVQGVKCSYSTESGINISTVQANPTKFYKNWDAVDSNVDGFWGGSWDETSKTGTTTKTIYDPCPKGYAVTPSGTWSNLINGTFDCGAILQHKNDATQKYGWFPATGQRRITPDCKIDQIAGTSSAWGSYSNNKVCTFLRFTSGTFEPERTPSVINVSYALPVRCCKIPDTVGGSSEQPQQK